jgi:hypothetical protein
MFLYILNKSGSQENQSGGKVPNFPKVFHNRENAEMECHRLNSAGNGGYELTTVGVADNEAEPFASARLCGEMTEAMVRSAARGVFVACCRPLFAANADLDSFGWSQLPEGDALGGDFSTSADSPCINSRDGDELCQAEEESLEATLQRVVAEFLDPFSYELLRFLFGEDCFVTINRQGEVTVE